MKISPSTINAVRVWLEQPSDSAIPEMANILFQLNRNRILYSNILRRPQYMRRHLEYQLRKALASYLQPANPEVLSVSPANTKEERSCFRLDAAVKKAVSAQHKGARSDHESLPDEIKELYEGSKDRWFRMKELHNTLQQMDGCSDTERIPYTRQLRILYGEYRKCLNRYDHYDASASSAVKAPSPVQQVSAARKYISDNRKKLCRLIEEGDQDSAQLLRDKMQVRIDLIVANGGGFDHDYKEDLEGLGLDFHSADV